MLGQEGRVHVGLGSQAKFVFWVIAGPCWSYIWFVFVCDMYLWALLSLLYITFGSEKLAAVAVLLFGH